MVQALLWSAGRALPADGQPTGGGAGTESIAARQDGSGGPEERRVSKPAPEDRIVRPPDGGPGSGWLRTLLALAAVVAVIFVLRYLLRRMGASGLPQRHRDVMRVLARSHLTARQQLFLVELGRRLVLVGCGPTGLRTLAEVKDPDEIAEVLAAAESGRTGLGGSFMSILKRRIRGGPAASDDGHGSSDAPPSRPNGGQEA